MSRVSELLRTTLETLQMTQKKLADETGLSPKHINGIAQGKTGITGRTALLLQNATKVPAETWYAARAADEIEEALNEMPSAKSQAQRYVQEQLEAQGFDPQQSRLTGRDREVIRLVLDFLGVK